VVFGIVATMARPEEWLIGWVSIACTTWRTRIRPTPLRRASYRSSPGHLLRSDKDSDRNNNNLFMNAGTEWRVAGGLEERRTSGVSKGRTLLVLPQVWNPVHRCNQISAPASNNNSTKRQDPEDFLTEELPKGLNGIKPIPMRLGMPSPGGSGCRVSLDKRGRSIVARSEDDSMRPTVR
jgi:hypothetical protein